VLLLLAAAACSEAGAPLDGVAEIAGPTMGTEYRVKVVGAPDDPRLRTLDAQIAELLAGLDARLSTWRDDSEISRFNAARDTGWFAVSADTASVVAEALAVHRLSEGALDPTVAPLVELWGFGRGGRGERPPDPARVRELLARVGAGQLELRAEPPAVRKARPDLALDLSAVAQGFAADAIARHLTASGFPRHLVEVGGELRGRGPGPSGEPWRVGIERPSPEGFGGLYCVVGLSDGALATSGSYRKFVVWDGARYAHILDPRSGVPVSNALASVSVLDATAARADALATALFVLGPDAGLRLAEREGLAVLFLVGDGPRFREIATPAFDRQRIR
jgi:thiamine biosynthesis lipoprotein